MEKVDDFYCYTCKSNEGVKTHITKTFNDNGKKIIIPNVPILKCLKCGDTQIEYEGMEMIERALNQHITAEDETSVTIETETQ